MIFRVGMVLGLLLWAFPATSHDFWMNGQEVDPVTKNRCCGVSDCKIIPSEIVHITPNGYIIEDTSKSRISNDELIPFSRAQISPDGLYYQCKDFYKHTACFFAPPFGAFLLRPHIYKEVG